MKLADLQEARYMNQPHDGIHEIEDFIKRAKTTDRQYYFRYITQSWFVRNDHMTREQIYHLIVEHFGQPKHSRTQQDFNDHVWDVGDGIGLKYTFWDWADEGDSWQVRELDYLEDNL